MGERAGQSAPVETTDARVRPLLSVVVPVFNQEGAIAENVATIRGALEAGLGDDFELIVVSDGSIDRTAERVVEQHAGDVRVIHYDRNLGKGYAVKIGALEARGRYVGYIDADLDLDPAWLPKFVATAEERDLDFAIGSKRHPDSDVFYPRSRRVASWLYQQLVRLLFRLNVRDTQVGLKVFRREVGEQVLPLLLVKRYAFDLEFLAVSRALGFSRIEELPIRLDYRFTGSGVRSLAVLRALVDTSAIFYRLRILRYYQRKRALAGAFGWTRPRGFEPLVSILAHRSSVVGRLDYSNLEVIVVPEWTPEALRKAAERACGSVLAFLEEGARPAGNWISATVPFLRRQEVAGVVAAKVAPREGSLRSRASAAVVESRLGGGSLYYRFTPGNLRYVDDFPGGSIVVDRARYLALDRPVPLEELPGRLSEGGNAVLYTPETLIVGRAPRLFRPHLRHMFSYGSRRGIAVRRRGPRAIRLSTLPPVAVLVLLLLAPLLAVIDGLMLFVWLVAVGAYGCAVVVSAATAALSYRSLRVGALAGIGLVVTHIAYAVGFVRGIVST